MAREGQRADRLVRGGLIREGKQKKAQGWAIALQNVFNQPGPLLNPIMRTLQRGEGCRRTGSPAPGLPVLSKARELSVPASFSAAPAQHYYQIEYSATSKTK